MPGRRTAGAAGGLIAAGLLDRALAPQLKPLSGVAAAAVGASQSIGPVRVYQYAICPFCNKVKSLLDLYQVPYETVDVNPLTKQEVKAWSGGYRKVPISLFGDEQVNDSPVIATRIMDELEAAGTISKTDAARFRSPAALKWAEWSDKEFAVLLFPNITRNFGEAYEAFGYVHEVPHFSIVDKWSNQFVGAFAMWMAQGKIKKKYGIEDERAAVYAALARWVDEAVGSKPFAGGASPDFADVCVFGCLNAIDRTTAFGEIMAETAVKPWYVREPNTHPHPGPTVTFTLTLALNLTLGTIACTLPSVRAERAPRGSKGRVPSQFYDM